MRRQVNRGSPRPRRHAFAMTTRKAGPWSYGFLCVWMGKSGWGRGAMWSRHCLRPPIEAKPLGIPSHKHVLCQGHLMAHFRITQSEETNSELQLLMTKSYG